VARDVPIKSGISEIIAGTNSIGHNRGIGLKLKVINALLVCHVVAAAAHANTFTFWTVGGASTGTGLNERSVAARVTFITGPNQIEIDVTNLQTDTSRIWQTVSAVDFLVQGVSGVNPTKIDFKTGDSEQGWGVTFANSTTLSPSTISLGNIANPWTFATSTQLSGGSEIGAIHGTANAAKDLILGSGPYNADGNGSGTMQHSQNNQYLLTAPTTNHLAWILTYAPTNTINENSTIESARMTFGLTFTGDFEENLTLDPEPGTVAMMVGGLGLILIGAWRRRSGSGGL